MPEEMQGIIIQSNVIDASSVRVYGNRFIGAAQSQYVVRYTDPAVDYDSPVTVPSYRTCLYCDRSNPQEHLQCDGCGASLHLKKYA